MTSSTNTVTVDGNGNTIDGASSLGLSAAHAAATLIYDGAGDWLQI